MKGPVTRVVSRLVAGGILTLAALVAMGQTTPPTPGVTVYKAPPPPVPMKEEWRPRVPLPYPADRISSMPEKFRAGWANLITLNYALGEYYEFEGRLPATLDELMRSDEMPVQPADLINPYTGKPVKSVVTQSLGDIRYVYKPDVLHNPDVHLEVFLDPTGDGKSVETLTWWRNFWRSRDTFSKLRDQFGWQDRYRGSDRRMWFLCRSIWQTARGILNYSSETVPNTFAEILRRYDGWLSPKLKNPYTGADIKEVSSPSAGNFTFAGEPADFNNPASDFNHIYVICYDSTGAPLYPDPAEEYSIANRLELAAGENLPTGAVAIMNLPAGVTFKKKPK